jgi:hypothetical protein
VGEKSVRSAVLEETVKHDPDLRLGAWVQIDRARKASNLTPKTEESKRFEGIIPPRPKTRF